ncbi:FtsX-like permease family protein [Pedococcus sp. KACC 23699]|uniref:FtsX-like permease family protein n=1 Tax=Pedococcus sp. KACC 23699 TaxID=3149228 RepID=A0AAU7JV29_9MICO
MWAAIRYRRAQAVVLVLLSTLVTACAVFAPLYERGLEQSLLRSAVDGAPVADTALVARGGRTSTDPLLRSESLASSVPREVSALYAAPIGQMSDVIDVVPRTGLKPSPGRIVARTDACTHLTLTSGSCPANDNEVLVSAKDQKAWGWTIGQVFRVDVPGPDVKVYPRPPDTIAPLKVVGFYGVKPDPAYWLRTQLDGKSGTLIPVGTEIVPGIDDFVTTEKTFGKAWVQVSSTLTYPLRRELLSVDNLEEVTGVIGARGSGSSQGSTLVESELPLVISSVTGGQRQLRVIVPLLMAQLGLLAGAILLLVAQAAVEQRRPEAALARLRGRSREGAGRLVMAELGLTVAIGLPLGFGLAVLLSELVRRTLLAPGVPFEVPVLSLVALAAAAAVCALAIVVAVRPLQQQAISSLLRRVSPSRAGAFAVVDVLAVALAVFGLVGLATRTLTGPLALLTPTLVALAGGLVTSRLAVPVARSTGRTSLSRGQIGPALTAFGLQRRPAMRKVVTVVSVAVALTVFAANAVVVANRNWTARAQLQVGAPLVLETDSRNPTALSAAVRRIDPSGDRVTPVAVVRQVAADSTPTIAVDAEHFASVAYAPAGQQLRLDALRPPSVQTVLLRGQRITGKVTWHFATDTGGFSPPGQALMPIEMRLTVTGPDGTSLLRQVTTFPADGSGSATLSTPLLCPSGCRLNSIEFRPTDPVTASASGTVTVAGLGLDGRSIGVSDPKSWNAFAPISADSTDRLGLTSPAADTMVFDIRSSGVAVGRTYGDVPAQVPGLLAGRVPPGGTAEAFTAVSITGAPITISSAQRPAALPVVGARGVMVDFSTLERLGGSLQSGGTMSVWLKDPAQASAVRAGLTQAGIGVLRTTTYETAKERLDTSGSGWGIRLAVFTGLMAVLLAALVVVVMTVTGWRVVARDLAALHMAGVRLPVLRRALVREQLVLVAVGTAVGTVCGAVSALVAMPLLPLFDDPSTPVPEVQIAPSVPAVLLATVAALLVLLPVGAAAAVGCGRRIALRRIRESV